MDSKYLYETMGGHRSHPLQYLMYKSPVGAVYPRVRPMHVHMQTHIESMSDGHTLFPILTCRNNLNIIEYISFEMNF